MKQDDLGVPALRVQAFARNIVSVTQPKAIDELQSVLLNQSSKSSERT
jgi:hypothetical protein